MKPEKAYALIHPKQDYIDLSYIRYVARDVREQAPRGFGRPWSALYKEGWRVVRVTVAVDGGKS